MELKIVGIYAVVGLVLVGGGYAFGRLAQPAKVVEVEKQSTKEKSLLEENTKLQEQNRSLTAEVIDAKKNVKVVHVVDKRPDGSSTETTTTDASEETHGTKTEVKEVVKLVEVEKKVFVDRVVEVEKTKIVEAAKPNWKVDLMVGLKTTDLTHPLFGGDLQHRFIGPIYLGGFGLYAPSNNQLILGLSVGALF